MGFGNDFLDMAQKAQVTESKLNKWDHIKLKCFCTHTHTHTHTQETFNEVKKHYGMGKSILKPCV